MLRRVPPSFLPVSLLGDTFVRGENYTFCQLGGNQAGIALGYGPADIHPFHWWVLRNPGYSLFGLFRFIPDYTVFRVYS